MEGGAKESQGGRQRREEATGELLPLSATAQCRSLPCLHLLPTVAALASPRHCWSSFFCHNGHFFQLHHATGCTLLLATANLTSGTLFKSSPASLPLKCALIQLQLIQSAIGSNH